MKNYLLILTTVLCSFSFISDNPIDKLGVAGPLKFNKKSFNLAWAEKPKDTYYIQEYLPKGETLTSFNQMLTIHFFDTDISIEDAVRQKISELNDRKKNDPVCNYKVNENKESKEFLVDFLLGESKGELMTIAEFNIYRYRQVDLGNEKKGILVYTYSKRAYGEDITTFFNTLGEDREKLLKEMIITKMPTVAPNDK